MHEYISKSMRRYDKLIIWWESADMNWFVADAVLTVDEGILFLHFFTCMF